MLSLINCPSYLSFSLIQANGIIKKLQGEVRGLVGKIKVKNTVTVSQEKVLQETSDKLQQVEKDLQSTQQQLSTKEEQVCIQTCCIQQVKIVVFRPFFILML